MLYVLAVLFFGCLLIQTFYYLYYFKPLSDFSPIDNASQPTVSIVICAHNEEDNLKENLPSILNQNYPHFEVIVVNDRSTDHTNQIINNIENENLHLITIQSVENSTSPKKNALTKGFELAKGEFILLTDADCKAKSNEWIAKMATRITPKTDIVLGFSPYQQKEGWLNKLIQYDTFFTAIQYLSFALKRNAYMGVGRNLMIRKTSFFNVNGFKGFEKIIAGDDDIIVQKIANKENVEICIAKKSHMISIPEKTTRDWFKQKRRHLSVGTIYNNSSKWKVGLFQQSFVGLYLLFLTSLFLLNTELILIFTTFLIVRNLVINLSFNKVLDLKTIYSLPALEFLYFLHYLLIGVSVIIRKHNKWQ